jgi:hypothetical protein
VLIAPNNFICLFAGAAGMRIGWFFALNITGTVGRLYLIRVLGDAFSSPIDGFQDFVSEYRWWFIAGSAAAVAFSLRNEFRGGGGEIETLVHLDDELLDDDSLDAGPSTAGPSTAGPSTEGATPDDDS